jgi:predicted phosphodiesterase
LRLAIIADIHGNLHALEAVLADLDRSAADLVVVNGDLVNRGPGNEAVLERVRALGAPTTLGNHDDLMRKWVTRDPDIPAAWFDDPFWRGTAWAAERLERAGWIGWLAERPMTHRLDLPGAPSVLISHGSPRHYREGYGTFLTDESLAEIVRGDPADVLIGSHTHRPLQRSWNGHLVFNSGAVGAPFNGDARAQYLLLTLQDGAWRPEFRRVPYDREAALAAFESSGLLDEGGLSAHIFYQELRYARSFLTPFVRWSDEQGLGQSWEAWRRFTSAFAARFVGYDGG